MHAKSHAGSRFDSSRPGVQTMSKTVVRRFLTTKVGAEQGWLASLSESRSTQTIGGLTQPHLGTAFQQNLKHSSQPSIDINADKNPQKPNRHPHTPFLASGKCRVTMYSLGLSTSSALTTSPVPAATASFFFFLEPPGSRNLLFFTCKTKNNTRHEFGGVFFVALVGFEHLRKIAFLAVLRLSSA